MKVFDHWGSKLLCAEFLPPGRHDADES